MPERSAVCDAVRAIVRLAHLLSAYCDFTDRVIGFASYGQKRPPKSIARKLERR